MDRGIVYPGAIPQDTDILWLNRRAMIALGYLAQMVLGTSTVVDGLACTPTSPASMVVNVGQGSILSLEEIDPNAYGSLPSDTNPLMKMGINPEGQTPFTITAPGTSGYSQNYLIEATFQETDETPVVLPYYNAANPSQPYSGPNNDGVAQNTLRTEIVELQLKAGVAAPTGTQTTPAVDAGYTGLWVITVAHGQSTITSSNITEYPHAPFIANKLPAISPAVTLGNGNVMTNSSLAGGQCRLGYVSSTSINLSPKNGNNIIIDGEQYQLPAAGIAGANTGVLVNGASGNLAASTPYYVSVYNNNGTLTLAFWAASTYGHMPDTTAGNVGVEVIESSGTPESAHSLVGLLATNASSQFSDADGNRLLLSWFNRSWKRSQTTFSTNRTTTSSSFTEINSEIRNNFLCWSTDDVRVHLNGSAANSTTNPVSSAISFDGSAVETVTSTNQTSTSDAPSNIALNFEKEAGVLSETAQHYATVEGAVSGSSSTGTWFATTSAGLTSAVVLGIEVNG